MSGGNNDWAKNFKARLEDVGWRVELSGTSHYKVFDADNKLLLTFSGTPGGGNRGMMNALGQAKRAGLLTLETNVKLQREKERLQKIESDRAANDEKLADIKAQSDLPADERDVDALPVLGYVNGVAIVAIAPAMTQTPIMKEAKPLADGSEIMLADHTVLYRCEKPAATASKPDLEGICHRTFESASSLRVHIASHKFTHTTKNFTRKQEDDEPMAAATSPNGVPVTTKISTRLNEALESVALLAKGLESVGRELTEIQTDLSKLQVADDDTLKKAAQFDNLKAMLS